MKKITIILILLLCTPVYARDIPPRIDESETFSEEIWTPGIIGSPEENRAMLQEWFDEAPEGSPRGEIIYNDAGDGGKIIFYDEDGEISMISSFGNMPLPRRIDENGNIREAYTPGIDPDSITTPEWFNSAPDDYPREQRITDSGGDTEERDFAEIIVPDEITEEILIPESEEITETVETPEPTDNSEHVEVVETIETPEPLEVFESVETPSSEVIPELSETPNPVEILPRIEPIEISETDIADVPIPFRHDNIAGQGEIENPLAYWQTNGFPENISYAFNTNTEISNDGTEIAFWVIGIVDAEDTSRQEIINLLSPNIRVTFRNSTVSFNRRYEIYTEIFATIGDIVRRVVMTENSERIIVDVAGEFAAEYQEMYFEQYGFFVGVETSDTEYWGDSITGGLWGGESGGYDGGNPISGGFWQLPMVFIFSFCLAIFVVFAIVRIIPVMQTNRGKAVTANTSFSKKQTIAAIKASALTPSDSVFDAVMNKINN